MTQMLSMCTSLSATWWLNINFSSLGVGFKQYYWIKWEPSEMYLIQQLKLYEIPFIVLTFKLQVLCSAFRQGVEGVTREVGRWVKHMRLPLLQDVLQQLIQDIPCGDVKVKGELYVSQVTFCARVKNGKLVCRRHSQTGFPSSSLSTFHSAGTLEQ